MISLKIDVTKIDKDRLFQGQKGTYLDATLIPTPDSKFGDYMIVQSVSKEERLSGKKGPILGNGKIIVRSSAPQAPAAPSRPAKDDDIPF